MRTKKLVVSAAAVAVALGGLGTKVLAGTPSVARQWNEAQLDSIRKDFARPTIHARNLFHVSVAMWDAWAAYDPAATQHLHIESATAKDVEAARRETISYAAFRVLRHRYRNAPGWDDIKTELDQLMADLGYDTDFGSTVGDTPAALGNRIAATIIAHGLTDGANELGGYANRYYEPVNVPLLPELPGNPQDLSFPPDGIPDYTIDPNRWQPLSLEFFVDQGGVEIGAYPEALSPEWGIVTPFSLTEDDLTIYHRDGFDYWVYHDPGPPAYVNGVGDEVYKAGFEQVVEYSSKLDPTDGVMIDISPASIGGSTLGMNDGTGYDLNPITGLPYDPQIVPEGDYYRILAEFWADGPDSETPPGHWFTIANYVSDQLAEKRLGGAGPVLDELEWDVKLYFTLGGAMHDVAIAAWGVKGWYDYVRPISAIRYLAQVGQCTDSDGPSYDPGGINLHPDLIEVVTAETTMPGGKHEHLAGDEGKIAVFAWRGPDYIAGSFAGVGWILAENWWPYQRPTFVSPPFPGYVSGHSTYSRAAAEMMARFTGSEYFPGGMGEFYAPQNAFLVFEEGPSVDCTLQWAKYSDASDQCSLSRIYGGIHPTIDDIPGRLMGHAIGPEAFEHALTYFGDLCGSDLDGDGATGFLDLLEVLAAWGPCGVCPADVDGSGVVDFLDLLEILAAWGPC